MLTFQKPQGICTYLPFHTSCHLQRGEIGANTYLTFLGPSNSTGENPETTVFVGGPSRAERGTSSTELLRSYPTRKNLGGRKG